MRSSLLRAATAALSLVLLGACAHRQSPVYEESPTYSGSRVPGGKTGVVRSIETVDQRQSTTGGGAISLTRFGAATVTDNCSATIRDSIVRNLNYCGLGTITRYFIATDVAGNRVVRSQLITVGNNLAFSANDIDWPDTYTTDVSCLADLDPKKLPLANAEPRYIRNTQCSQLAFTQEDIIFNFADNVCVKVLRQWKVIDWCQKNPFIAGSGEWTYTQLLMVNNIEATRLSKSR